MSDLMVAFFVPVILFLVVVAPIWIIMHYRSQNRRTGELSADQRAEIRELVEVANHMVARIETLESILDDETPGWRRRHDSRGERGDAAEADS